MCQCFPPFTFCRPFPVEAIPFPTNKMPSSSSSSPALLPFLFLLLAMISAFCCTFVRAQADPRLEDDLFLRNLLLRQYQSPSIGQSAVAEEDIPVTFSNNLWRHRRTPAERAKLFRLSDQYTPTPCRWKLCASIFKGAFRR